jgi:hypothetical protein
VSYLESGADAGPEPSAAAHESSADWPQSSTVAAAVQELAGLSELPLAEHPDVYQRIHTELQGALADIDDA